MVRVKTLGLGKNRTMTWRWCVPFSKSCCCCPAPASCRHVAGRAKCVSTIVNASRCSTTSSGPRYVSINCTCRRWRTTFAGRLSAKVGAPHVFLWNAVQVEPRAAHMAFLQA